MKSGNRSARVWIALAGLLAVCACGKAAATPEGPQARVVDVINDVDADPMALEEWEDALEDMVIYLEGKVWAKEASTSRVQTEQALVRVAPNTVFTFGQPDEDTMQVSLEEGQIWVTVEGLEPGETFEVEMPGVVAAVRGTSLSARVEADGTAIVSTQVGTVTVYAATQVVTVTEGMLTAVPHGSAPIEPRMMTPEEQVLWGMAAGAHLDVVLPVVATVGDFTYDGYSVRTDWSPDGHLVTSYYDVVAGAYGQHFYDTQTTSQFTVTLPAEATGLSYCPTGDWLAYRDNAQICTADLDGSNPTCWGGHGYYGWPFPSPNCDWVLFYSDLNSVSGEVNLFAVHPDGTYLTQLTLDEQGKNGYPVWSPDGSQIAYVRTISGDQLPQLWVMGADGSDQHMVLDGVGGGFAAWSPDGDWLAMPGYEYAPGEGAGLYLVQPDGSGSQMVTGTEGIYCNGPVWSPSHLGWPLFYYGSNSTTGQHGLYYVSGAHASANYFGYFEWGPVWGPAGEYAAFGTYDYSVEPPAGQTLVFQTVPGLYQ
jgi:WD40 repeat protein